MSSASAGKSTCGDEAMEGLLYERSIEGVQRNLGVLQGRMSAVESGVKEVNDTLKKLLEQNAMIAELQRVSISHDKRLGAIERRCSENGPALLAFAEHVRTDKPVDAVAGEWALRVVIFVGGAGGMWLLSKLPRIWELLGG